MDTQQIPTDQNSTVNKVPPQQGVSNNSRLFLVVAMSVLLTTVLAGSAVYFWQKSANEKTINNLEQKIKSLEEQISAIKNTEAVPQLTPSPLLPQTSTIDPVANWKTYTNEKFSWEFKYPAAWKVKIASATGAPNYGNFILDEQTPEYGYLFEIATSVSKSNESPCMTFLDPKNEFKKTNVEINNINWIRYEDRSNVFFKAFNPEGNYCVRFYINPGAQNKELDIFGLILSTFKFID